MTVKETIVKAGRSYKVGQNGAGDVSIKYQLVLTEPLAATELPTEFPGVPAIGSEHPTRPGLYALSYDVTQPDGAAKNTLDVTVNYGPTSIEPLDPEHPEYIEAVKEWGWDDGTGEKELVASVAVGNEAAKPVVNSAGDPFDSVPMVNAPAPTFTKVIQCSERKSGYSAFLCKVNSAEITIGDVTCSPGTLLCTIAERKIIGEWRLPYEYTIHLRYRSNVVTNTYPPSDGEIGWDAAVVDAGMREIDSTTHKLKLIQVISKETGQPATVTAPELLDGHGAAQTRDSQGLATPMVLTFHAYERADFPEWFYSEPPTPEPPDDEEEGDAVISGGE